MEPDLELTVTGLLGGKTRPRYVHELRARASQLNVLLPPSLFEAYEVAGAFLDDPSVLEVDPDSNSQRLFFRYEEQSVWIWAICLNGSPDPPVVAALNERLPQGPWLTCAERLSTFIYATIFDVQYWMIGSSKPDSGAAAYGTTMVGEVFDPLTEEDLDFLRSSFAEEPQTFGLPAPVTYRFSDGFTKRITINQYNGPAAIG
jgi:hypothetical protein